MRTRTIVGIVALVLGAWSLVAWMGYAAYRTMTPVIAKLSESQRQAWVHHAVPKPPPMRPASVPAPSDAAYTGYFQKVRAVEKIADPLQRCLAYPDPPGLHWYADTTAAYCRYRTQVVISMAEARQLVTSGHAEKLDAILAGYRDAQLHDPAHAGLLERAYMALDFECSCTQSRPMIDAWLKQRPDSAFALAASGIAHQGEAQRAARAAWRMEHESARFLASHPELISRNKEWIPRETLARDTALHLARQDLDMAVARDATVLPVYSAMMSVGWMSSQPLYIEQAIRRGLAVDPLSFRIRSMAYSHWYKGLRATPDKDEQIQQATALIEKNPLLRLMIADDTGDGYEEGDPAWMIQRALDGGASYAVIDTAAANAFGQDPKMSAALYSQSIRFRSNDADIPRYRAQMLYAGGEKAWANDEFDKLVAASPQDAELRVVRGVTFEHAGEDARAEAEFLAALRLEPDDVSAMGELVDLYSKGNRLDQALDIVNRLIKVDPSAPTGYLRRANVLIEHNRPDARDAAKYVVDHFAGRSDLGESLDRMRHYLRTHTGGPAAPPPSH